MKQEIKQEIKQENLPLVETHYGNKKILLLGTAHISEESVKDVKYAIETFKPDIVAIELDEAREKKLTQQDTAWQELNMFKVLKQKKAMFLLSSILLSSFQKKLGENLSVRPGAEMLAAIQESKAHNIDILLADRPVEITLKRAWNNSSFWGRQKIIAILISSIFYREKISEEEMQELKQKSIQGQLMEELTAMLPSLKSILVDERDEYLTTKILQASGDTVLAVLGAAHVPGIKKRIETLAHPKESTTQDSRQEVEEKSFTQRINTLEIIPPKKKVGIVHFIIPTVVLGLFVYGFFRGGIQNVTENFTVWWLVNGGLSFVCALLAFAHPFTMILSFLAAPLTSLNPFVGVGLVAGLSETFFRAPRVKDFEELQNLSLSLRALYKNRVTHILLVLVATTIGSAAGTFIGLSLLATNV